MNALKSQVPLVKLPSKIEYSLFLIKEELKSRRFFQGLHSVGMEDIHLQPHMDKLILKSVGLDDGTDATNEFFFEIMERRSMKVDSGNDSLVTQALKVYFELTAEKKRRKDVLKNSEF